MEWKEKGFRSDKKDGSKNKRKVCKRVVRPVVVWFRDIDKKTGHRSGKTEDVEVLGSDKDK